MHVPNITVPELEKNDDFYGVEKTLKYLIISQASYQIETDLIKLVCKKVGNDSSSQT